MAAKVLGLWESALLLSVCESTPQPFFIRIHTLTPIAMLTLVSMLILILILCLRQQAAVEKLLQPMP